MRMNLDLSYLGQAADRELKILHNLDTGFENLYKNFEVSTICGGCLAAHFSKVPKLEAVHLHTVSFLQFFRPTEKTRKFPSVKLLFQPFRTCVQIFSHFQ